MGVRRLPDPRMPSPRTAPPVEVNGPAKQPLGIPAADILPDYWQKKQLMIRNTLPGFVSPIEPEDPAGPARDAAGPSPPVLPGRSHDSRTGRPGPAREGKQNTPTTP